MGEQKKNQNAKGNKNILLIVIAIVLIIGVVGGGAFAGYYFATKNAPVAQQQPSSHSSVEETTIELEEMIVNLADDSAKRFLKIKLVIAYDSKNKKFAKELESKKVVVKDSIISVIRAKKATDLTPKGSEDLKTEILTRVNAIFSTGKLTNVYYSDFLVQ